jgi:peptidoglycan/xylan/chitin deacetylase (PgdA/CDA1 family)
MFVPSGCLGERPSWVRNSAHPFWRERVVSADELRQLAEVDVATIGSHSVTHRNLVDLDPAHIEHELVRSRFDLEAALGRPVDLFSFPHGGHNPSVIDQVRRAGYRRAFTIEPTPLDGGGEPFTVGRVAADPDDWRLEFHLKIVGAYRWQHYLHRLRNAV